MIWNRHAAYALVRITLGVILLFSGISKLLVGPGTFADGLAEDFADTILPMGLVTAFGYVLPFAEVGLGALLLVGLLTPAALAGTGALMVLLTFGTVMLPDPPVVANNLFYALVAAVLLWLEGANAYSVDGLVRRRRVEAAAPPAGLEPMPPVPRPTGRRWAGRRTPAGRPPAGPQS